MKSRTGLLVATLVVGVLALGVAGTVTGQTSSAPDCSTVGYNGTGTAGDPYQVGNVSQLQCLNENHADAVNQTDARSSDYALVDDVDASGTDQWNGGAGFTPIDRFDGSLDGQGYEIANLTIDRPSERRVGLFGETFGTVDVTDLGLVDVDVTGSFTSGTLLGLGDANVSDSYVTGTITGENVGGLIGRFNGGKIERSYTDVEVVSTSGNAGGLVETMNGGTIEESFALGDAEGGGGFASVGGLIGFAGGGTVQDSYARGNATATGSNADAGGFVGSTGDFSSVSIENAYSTGVASGDTNEGGFAGVFEGSVSNGYWDTEASGLNDGIGSGSGDVTGLTTSEMTGTSAETNVTGFDFTGTWATVSSPDDYPILRWQSEAGAPYFVVDITGTDSPVTENGTLAVAVDVQNVGGAEGTQTVELFYDDSGDGNAGTSADSAGVDALSAEEGRTVELEWNTDDTVVPDTEPQQNVAIRTTSEDDSDTDSVTVQREFDERVAIVSSNGNLRGELRTAVGAGLTDAGERGAFGLVRESPSAVTGADAADAVAEYDALVINDFGGIVSQFEGSTTPEVSDSDIQQLYDNVTADGDTRLVSLDNGEVLVSTFGGSEYENVSNAISKRSAVLGDPAETNNLEPTDAPARINITADHPLFRDVGTEGETVPAYNNESIEGSSPPAPISWFSDSVSGEVVGEVGNATQLFGPAAGVTTNDNEVLLSLGGAGRVEPTNETERILANALLFPFADAEVDSCPRVIDQPGDYEITGDVVSNDTCILITASDVTLDGNGNNVTGGSDVVTGAAGIFANGTAGGSGEISNVTVRNVTVQNWDTGVDESATGVRYVNVTGGEVSEMDAPRNAVGVELRDAANVTVTDSDVGGDIQLQTGVRATDSRNLTVSNLTVTADSVDEETGIELDGVEDTTVRNNTVTGAPDETSPNAFGVAITVSGGQDNELVDNEIGSEDEFDVVFGVEVAGSSGTAVLANRFRNIGNAETPGTSGGGIRVGKAGGANVSDNKITSVTPLGPSGIPFGINVTGSDSATITGNDVEEVAPSDPSRGILVNGSAAVRVDGNNVTEVGVDGDDSSAGIEVGSDATPESVTGNEVTVADKGIVVANGTDGTQVSDNLVTGAEPLGLSVANADGVTVENNTVRDSGVDDVNAPAALRVESTDDAAILDNDVLDIEASGLEVIGGQNNTVGNNLVVNASSIGIDLTSSDGNAVTGNRVNETNEAGTVGIGIGAGVNNTVSNNTLRDNAFAISAFNSTDAEFRENVVTGSGDAGISISGGSSGVVVADNEISGTAGGVGVELTGFFDSPVDTEIRNNTIEDGARGVSLGNATSALVTGNDVHDTTVAGIQLFSEVTETDVDNNTITGSGDSGITLTGVDGNTLENNTVSASPRGVVATDDFSGVPATGAEVLDTTVRGADWAFVAENGSTATVENLDIGASTAANTTLSFDAENVGLAPVDSPPADPENNESVGRYFEAESTNGGALTNLELGYDPGDLGAAEEDSLSLFRFDETATRWEEVTGSEPATGRNVVTANVTAFSTFGAFAQEPAFFNVTITGTNGPVTEGDTLEVTANVTNTGDVAATQTVTLADTGFTDTQRDAVDVTLAGGESNESVLLDWSTSPGDAGTGDVTVATDDDTDTEAVTVQQPAAFVVNITGTNDPVTEGDTLQLTANVTNAGDAAAAQTVTLADTGFDDTQRDAVGVTLAGGESNESVLLNWTTSPGDAGTGDVTVATGDDSDSQEVTVQEPAAFVVNITDTNEPVTEGDTLQVTANVTNTGDVETTQTVTLTDTGFNDTQRDAVDVTLAGGESNESVLLNWTTSPGDAGTGDVTVASDDDTDSQQVTVQEPAAFMVTIDNVSESVVAGEDAFIEYTVTNAGDVSDTQDVVFSVNGSQQVVEPDVTLDSGENTTGSFTYATEQGDVPGIEVIVATEDDAAARNLTVDAPGGFEIVKMHVDGPVSTDDRVHVIYGIENVGGQADTQDIELYVDGELVDAEPQTLAPGERVGTGEERGDREYLVWPSAHCGDGDDVTFRLETEDDSESETVEVTGCDRRGDGGGDGGGDDDNDGRDDGRDGSGDGVATRAPP